MNVLMDSRSTENALWEQDFKFIHMNAMQDSKNKPNPPNNSRDTQTSLCPSGRNNRRANYDRQRGSVVIITVAVGKVIITVGVVLSFAIGIGTPII